ncbi:MAG: NTP transferase domain-containing protein [Rhodococcus sp.]|uniref:NTP transferase domain-containing protein n=1 Tax=Rhodococcus sp. TaxID=1831 RepID=UPI0016A6B58A|nr:NTP transferase domain-containing protein [Rhodococcus sp. (in: high G+C Gram-positive bacteria)]NLV79372.1 NTP transferase domain-containing protein [Rhodococcus sp. (in: high G+C Gram-positive bacteria)]
MSTPPVHEAVIVAGGRATRMGGLDKPAQIVAGRRMLDAAVAAVAGLDRVTVVGPPRDGLGASVTQVRESPAGSGPVAALAAARPAADVVVTLPSDLPFVTTDTVTALLDALRTAPDADAAFAVDDTGRVQFLVAAWRGAALASRLAALGDVVDRPVRALLPDRHVTVAAPGIDDCDTLDDLARARTGARDHTEAPGPARARTLVRNAQRRLPVRTVPPAEAFGTTLATPLVAAGALPPVATSAMDGYAVAGDGPWSLRTEIRTAGSSGRVVLDDGQAVRIATGAHLPPGATSVVRDEFVSVTGSVVTLLPDAPRRDDARAVGEDWLPGTLLADAGVSVTPAVVSAAFSGEVTALDVRGPLRVHLVITGDEIRRTGPLEQGQTRDSLGPVLPRFVEWCGARVSGEQHLRDTADGFDVLLRDTVDTDALVIVGATGGGAADQLRGALDRAGAEIVVDRVRCKPGGSQVSAVLPDGRAVLGLPGNPVAAVGTLMVVLPAVVCGRTGRASAAPLVAPLVNAGDVAGDRTRLLPAYRDEEGRWLCDNAVRTSHLAGLIGRDAIALVPPHAVDGDDAEFLPLPG